MNKQNIYKNSINKYGFLPLLFLLSEYEIQEKYTECNTILKILCEHSEKYNLNFSYKFNNNSIEDYKQQFWKLGLSGEIATKNLLSYVDDIKKELKKL